MEATTAATSAIDDSERKQRNFKGCTIAPIEFSNFSDLELERVLRKRFRDNAHIFSQGVVRTSCSGNKFSVVDKNIHGPKMVEKKTESLLKAQNEWYEYSKPAVGAYNPNDNICWPDAKEAKFG